MIDLRPEDIVKLEEYGINRDWVFYWEDKLSREVSEIKNANQKDWHISRMSFLEGYKLGQRNSSIS